MVNGHTKTLGLLGYPVKHTLSPVIHNELSKIMAKNEMYLPFEVSPDGLHEAVQGAFQLGILGMNVTVPHKNSVMSELESVNEDAKAIGAVNTLVRGEKGYIGYNTDMTGLYRALVDQNITLKDREIIILGAGGAAKAVIYMCLKYGAKKVYLYNRTKATAMKLAEYYNDIFEGNRIIPDDLDGWKNLKIEQKYLVFQTTSCGLAPDVDKTPVNEDEFYNLVHTAVDLIYNPWETLFLRKVKEHGGITMNGLKMLLYQGIEAYELWNHVSVKKEFSDKVYEKLVKEIRKKRNIIFVGFMGTGKTTVSKELSKKMHCPVIDTDAYIEQKEGMRISDIFEKKGEQYFREVERKILEDFDEEPVIISTGGGLPLRKENADALKQLGTVILLTANEDIIWQRVKEGSDRPLLNVKDPRNKIHQLLNERMPAYENVADYILDTGNSSIDEIVEQCQNLF